MDKASIPFDFTEQEQGLLLRTLREWLTYLWGEQRAAQELNPEKENDPLWRIWYRQAMHAREVYDRVQYSPRFRLTKDDISVVGQAVRRSMMLRRGEAAEHSARGVESMAIHGVVYDFNDVLAQKELQQVDRLMALVKKITHNGEFGRFV